MNKFMQASRLGLTFAYKGTINVNDLWKLSIPALDSLAQDLNAQIEATPTQSFIKSTVNKVCPIVKLRFDIVIEVLNTLVEERVEKIIAQVAATKRAQLDKLIADAEGSELASKPLAELKKMRADL